MPSLNVCSILNFDSISRYGLTNGLNDIIINSHRAQPWYCSLNIPRLTNCIIMWSEVESVGRCYVVPSRLNSLGSQVWFRNEILRFSFLGWICSHFLIGC